MVNDRIRNAPNTTRARVRGAFIRTMCENTTDDIRVDWSRLQRDQRICFLLDPYDANTKVLKKYNVVPNGVRLKQ